MGQATLKASRRQIRRAFGESAVDAITSRDDVLKAVAVDHAKLKEILVLQTAALQELTASVTEAKAISATWRRRLRWLVLGR